MVQPWLELRIVEYLVVFIIKPCMLLVERIVQLILQYILALKRIAYQPRTEALPVRLTAQVSKKLIKQQLQLE